MTRNRLGVALLLPLLALAACAAISGASQIVGAIQSVAAVAGRPAAPALDQTAAVVPASNATVGDRIILRASQALLVAHNGYQTAAAVAEAYVRAGQSTPAQRARIRVLNDRALALLDLTQGGLTVAQRAAEVLNIVAELNAFGGRR